MPIKAIQVIVFTVNSICWKEMLYVFFIPEYNLSFSHKAFWLVVSIQNALVSNQTNAMKYFNNLSLL